MALDRASDVRQEAQDARGGALREPVYLTVADVAGMLGVDAKTVTRWAREDASMPVWRRGRVVRFPRQRLHDWLRRHERRPTAA